MTQNVVTPAASASFSAWAVSWMPYSSSRRFDSGDSLDIRRQTGQRRRVLILQCRNQFGRSGWKPTFGHRCKHGFKGGDALANDLERFVAAAMGSCFAPQKCVFERQPKPVDGSDADRSGNTGKGVRGTSHRIGGRQVRIDF